MHLTKEQLVNGNKQFSNSAIEQFINYHDKNYRISITVPFISTVLFL
jgi:hypothetical protein